MGPFNSLAFSSTAFNVTENSVAQSKFIFLPNELRIVVRSGVRTFTTIELYNEWKVWATTNLKYQQAFRVVGGDPLGSGLIVASYFFLLNGWRIRPAEESHTLIITGNLFVEEGGTPVVVTLGNYQINVNYTVSVQAQGISTSGSTLTAADVATATWSHPFVGKLLTVAKFLGLK